MDEEDYEDASADGSGSGKEDKEEEDEDSPKVRRPRCCAPKKPKVNFLDWILSLDDRWAEYFYAISIDFTYIWVRSCMDR